MSAIECCHARWNPKLLWCPRCGKRLAGVDSADQQLVRLAPGTRIETTAIPSQLGYGPATDCWIVRDEGKDTVVIGYGHDDRATVPRSSIRLPDDTNTDAGSGCPASPCSRLSETPETDALEGMLRMERVLPIPHRALRLARKMERECNELSAAVRAVAAAVPGHADATGLSRLLRKYDENETSAGTDASEKNL